MDYKLFSTISSILISLFMIVTNSIDFNPVRFHCENYILNSYLYLFIAIAILMSTVFSMDNLNITLNGLFTGPYRFLLLLLSIILVVVLTMLPAKYFFTKHILWLIWTALLGTFIYPTYKQNPGLFYNSALTTAAIVTLLSILAFVKPELISDNWNFTLFILLAGLCISQVVEMILKSKGIIHSNKYHKLISYGTVILFSFFILYDTKSIIKNSKLCGISIEPDYINQSMDILLDSLNIFLGTVNIKD